MSEDNIILLREVGIKKIDKGIITLCFKDNGDISNVIDLGSDDAVTNYLTEHGYNYYDRLDKE